MMTAMIAISNIRQFRHTPVIAPRANSLIPSCTHRSLFGPTPEFSGRRARGRPHRVEGGRRAAGPLQRLVRAARGAALNSGRVWSPLMQSATKNREFGWTRLCHPARGVGAMPHDRHDHRLRVDEVSATRLPPRHHPSPNW
jgi:hypothetical protein